jgi:hypothetical protein
MMSRVHVNNHTRTKQNKVFFLSFRSWSTRGGGEKREKRKERAPLVFQPRSNVFIFSVFSHFLLTSLSLSLSAKTRDVSPDYRSHYGAPEALLIIEAERGAGRERRKQQRRQQQ